MIISENHFQFSTLIIFFFCQAKDYDLVVDEDQINFVMAEQIPGTKGKQVLIAQKLFSVYFM